MYSYTLYEYINTKSLDLHVELEWKIEDILDTDIFIWTQYIKH